MDEAFKDERFKHILSDPRYRKMPKHIRKVALDKRMKKIFKDSSFKGKCDLDKRGRPVNLTPAENLKRLYDMPSESSDDEEEEEDQDDNNSTIIKDNEVHDKALKQNDPSCSKTHDKADKWRKKEKSKEIIPYTKDTCEIDNAEESESDDCESDDSMDDQGNAVLTTKEKEKKVLSTEGSVESSSEESDDSDSESDASDGNQSEGFDHKWEESRNEAPDTDEINRRLAICNMDWDRIRAVDLFVCFNSFKPADGTINSIKIYPSDFGLKRMEEEKLNGPAELVEKTLDKEENDKKGSKYHREKLRQYQINRLKYYYAVVDCDSPETARILHDNLNGMEYESSSIRFDLRYIPDHLAFDDREPKDVADKLPDPSEYRPRQFVTSALQQVKVDLTWDETDPKRRDFFHKIFTDPDSVQNEIQDYLASASSESEAEENLADEEPNKSMKTKDRIAKYKELLQSLEEKEREEEEGKIDVEVTWDPVLKGGIEDKVKEKIKKEALNPFEEKLQKKREDKKMKKKELKAVHKRDEDSLSDTGEEKLDSYKSNGNTKDEKRLAELALISDSKKEMDVDEKPRKKNNKDKSRNLQNFVGDPNDPRFAAMHTSSLFDTTLSNFQKKNGEKYMEKSHKRKFKAKFNKSHKRSKF